MSMQDPIADLLTRIRNSCKAQHRYLDVGKTKIKLGLVKILKEHGFIRDVQEITVLNRPMLRILLKYDSQRNPVINDLKRVSKPSLRKYVGYTDIPKILGGMGIAILSTSKGILEGLEARKKKIGCELICYVW